MLNPSGAGQPRRQNNGFSASFSCGGSHDFDSFLQLSAQLGRDPMLTQGSNGNTSIKIDDCMWIKASGQCLANSSAGVIFLPLNLSETRKCLRQQRSLEKLAETFAPRLKPSIETAMHAVLPHRIVAHVHSINVLTHAIRADAQQHLESMLSGLRWRWIPPVPSGLPLARKVEDHVRFDSDVEILVLGNHGLVLCGDSCERIDSLLKQVESRLKVSARQAPEADLNFLLSLARRSNWRVAENPHLHGLATDTISRTILAAGNLYPAQAQILGGARAWNDFFSGLYSEASRHPEARSAGRPYLIVRGKGVLLKNDITAEQLDTLLGLAHVVQRIETGTPLRYLSESECGQHTCLSEPSPARSFSAQAC